MTCRARHWPVVFAAFLTRVLTLGFAGSMGVFYVEWKKAFAEDLPGDGSSSLGWLTSSVLGLLLATGPLAGALTHHFGVRPVVMAGGLLSTMGLFISSFAESVYLLFFTVPLMTGLGCGLSFAASVTIIAQYFHKRFALASGIASTGTSVGVITLPLIIQALINYYTWRNAIMIVAGIQAQVMICGALMKPKKSKRPKETEAVNEQHVTDRATHENMSSPKIFDEDIANKETVVPNGQDGDGDSTTVPFRSGVALDSLGTKKEIKAAREQYTTYKIATHEKQASPKISDEDNGNIETVVQNGGDSTTRSGFRVALDSLGISLLWTNRVYACTLPTYICSGAAYSTTIVYIKERAKQAGVPDFQSALLISIIGFSAFFARAGHGHLLDAKVFHPITLQSFAYFLAALTLPILAISEHYAVFVICALAIGFASGLYVPIFFVILRQIVGVPRFPGGMGLGLFTVAVSIMSTVAIAGYLLDTTGDYLAGFLYASLLQASSGVILLINHFVWTRCIKDSRWPPPLTSTCSKDHQDDQPLDREGTSNPAFIL